MPKLFLSYRRDDAAYVTGHIYDLLVNRYDKQSIFMDVDSISGGDIFTQVLEATIRSSQVMLVVIGRNWLGSSIDMQSQRISDPGDFVRMEVEIGLRTGIPIIPLLVSGAHMPSPELLPNSLRPLVTLNALQVRPEPDFHRDMERVIAAADYQIASRERRQELNQALVSTPGSSNSIPSQIPSASGSAESRLMSFLGTSGRHFARGLTRAIVRVILIFLLVALLATGASEGVAYWLTKQFPPSGLTHISAVSFGVALGGFAAAVCAIVEIVRAAVRTVQLVVQETERIAQQAIIESSLNDSNTPFGRKL